MIPQNPLKTQPNEETGWQTALKQGITKLSDLLRVLDLDYSLLEKVLPALKHEFPLRVPLSYVNKIRKGDIHDPLLRQILPLAAEWNTIVGFSSDPVQEKAFNPVPGLLHKYRGRALVTLTGACAIHCRYCFRRHFPYQENNPGRQHWPNILNYLLTQPDLCEVILSGGDPLTLKDALLETFIQALADIPHIRYLRIHSRLLSTIPERATPGLIQALTHTRLTCVMVLHINHPNEIDEVLVAIVKRLRDANITLFNQSVLLKGVNDDPVVLVTLQKKLFDAGILPYYLHNLDKVSGSAHFEVDMNRAKAIMIELMSLLPGYLVPKFVQEIPGAPAKMPVPLLY